MYCMKNTLKNKGNILVSGFWWQKMAAIFKKVLVIILVIILKNGVHFLKGRLFQKVVVQNLGSGLDVKMHKIYVLHD